ncbi:MAG: sulfatase-like hydrolase/transferase [Verrucomicrobiales bacterium]|nr:sulfatase-like hydrolase/transferase [Verrucomicrobiales bacterium]
MISLSRTLFALVLLALTPAGRAEAPRPNFLVIYTDDHGYGDVSTYGATDVKTPHIDSIAADGMLFTTMRANCTVCSPSRAALLTGRNQDRVGVPGVIRTQPENSWGYFDPAVPTLADELKKSGYDTAIVGKWHLGLESPNTPNERGFDHFHGFLGDMMDSYLDHLRHGNNYMRLNREVIEPQGHATELFSQWASDYLVSRAGKKDEPFLLYLAYNAPHFPIEPPADWLAKVKARAPGMEEKRAMNVAFVEHLDHYIGEVLKTLDESGLRENTVVVFTADNGGSLPHAQNNDPWRDGKQSHYEGGLRVPFMVRWPGQIEAGSKSDYAGQVFDLFPSFLELAGATATDPTALDAVSLVPVWKGEAITAPRELYFVRREGGRAYGGRSYEALIRGDWKLLQNDPYGPLELYNLKNDPGETTDLATKAPKVFNELSAALAARIQRGGATPWQKP